MTKHQMLVIIKSNLGFPNLASEETFGFSGTKKIYIEIWGQRPLTTGGHNKKLTLLPSERLTVIISILEPECLI